MTTPSWMPPLKAYPSPIAARNWSHEEMVLINEWARRFAIDAVEAYKASLKPMVWKVLHAGGTHHFSEVDIKDELPTVPLYRLDGGNDDAA